MAKLLIVDDEKEFRDLLSETFRLRGFDCITAKDGREGLRLARKELPSVIILDLVMPRMDGNEVYKKLKSSESTAGIPVIAYTAQEPEVLAKKGESAFELIDVIVKPFDTKELISLVEKAAYGNPAAK